jgi:DNA-binding transcriptional MocR family regulator
VEPAETDFVDLSLNHPLHAEDPQLNEALRSLSETSDLAELLRYHPSEGLPRHREAGARWIARHGRKVDPRHVLVCAGAQHALSVVFSAILKPGDLVLAEPVTYPGVKGIAELLKFRLAPVATDESGVLPEAFETMCRSRKVSALYLMPTIQNPTSTLLSAERRQSLARIAQKHGVFLVEDDVHRLFADDPPPPIASFAPEHTFFIASTSKSLAGGLRVAFLTGPRALVGDLARMIWASAWMVAPLNVEVIARWIDDGTAERVLVRKRTEARARQDLASGILQRMTLMRHPNGLYLWLELPRPWASAPFAAASRGRGVGVTPAELFVVGDGPAPASVRICLGAAKNRDDLRAALERIFAILTTAPDIGPSLV